MRDKYAGASRENLGDEIDILECHAVRDEEQIDNLDKQVYQLRRERDAALAELAEARAALKTWQDPDAKAEFVYERDAALAELAEAQELLSEIRLDQRKLFDEMQAELKQLNDELSEARATIHQLSSLTMQAGHCQAEGGET